MVLELFFSVLFLSFFSIFLMGSPMFGLLLAVFRPLCLLLSLVVFPFPVVLLVFVCDQETPDGRCSPVIYVLSSFLPCPCPLLLPVLRPSVLLLCCSGVRLLFFLLFDWFAGVAVCFV